MSREAMQQALEFCEFLWRDVMMNDYSFERLEQNITSLRAALAEPEQHDTDCHAQGICQRSGYSIAPTPRKPLTDEHVEAIIGGWWRDDLTMRYAELCRLIEHAHGIGEQHGS